MLLFLDGFGSDTQYNSSTMLLSHAAALLFLVALFTRFQQSDAFKNFFGSKTLQRDEADIKETTTTQGNFMDPYWKMLADSNNALFGGEASFLSSWLGEDQQDDDNDDVSDSLSSNSSLVDNLPQADVTHFCFLLHGINGFSKDLGYVKKVMRQTARTMINEKQKENDDIAPVVYPNDDQQQQEIAESVIGANVNVVKNDSACDNSVQHSTSSSSLLDPPETALVKLRHDFVVHACTSNERKTADGIANGGERVVDEIIEVIRLKMQTRQLHCERPEITVSVLGNSLGGIYGRYAIAKVSERCTNLPDGTCLLDDKYRIHWNVFYTTASPHLGCSGFTFIPIPRRAEVGVAHAMGQTGKDIFRVTPLLATMATSPEYLKPLGRFRKRVAYANAFRTDFPVPVHTAAFLSEQSNYPHHFEESEFDHDLAAHKNGLILAKAHTPQNSNFSMPESPSSIQSGMSSETDDVSVDRTVQEEIDEVVRMSSSLDALGWKKVFIDMRKEMPRLALPAGLLKKGSSWNSSDEISNANKEANSTPSLDAQCNNNNNNQQTAFNKENETSTANFNDDPIMQLKQKGIAGSREVAAAMSTSKAENAIHWPIGHNMMVAFSRNRVSTFMNRGGRPLVDALAKEMVEDIFSWHPLSDSESKAVMSDAVETAKKMVDKQ